MIRTEEINYHDGHTTCRGFLAINTAITKPMPCVMVAHDWEGRNQRSCEKAELLASLGYVGFAIDLYGNANIGKTKEERRAMLYPLLEQRHLITEKMKAAHHTIAARPEVNEKNMAAIGYCFGGLCALDLARAGADIKGAVSFHGMLTAPAALDEATIKAKLLVLHGYDDLLVPPEHVTQFASEMTDKKADWQLHMYGLTDHSFTNPTANDKEMGLHYSATADRRSWQSALNFLDEIFN